LLLAHLGPQELAHLLATDPDYRRFTKARRSQLQEVLETIRHRRFSTAANETYMGVRDIAVLVGSPHIGLTAALAVSSWMAPGKRKPLGQLRGGLEACAARITGGIGVATQ
jgi:DNA-binding IclR family transcriptional regulator